MPARQSATFYECQHVRPSGKKCRAIAIRDHRFCYFHLQSRRGYSAITPAAAVANGATAPAPQSATITLPMLEDRTAVQIVLTDVLRALAANQIDCKRASLLLYGLQIASSNCSRLDEIGYLHPVHSLELTPEGEEVGPLVETD
ncbi:hypothetical protein H7849_18460 [Alloacidobacterium dinghuense]|uniref:Uncharacterized protein n=1 Tax=Alloacidobacterium dinghuense TaxID=2763107 RepID=A0A7G8BEV0_9BACT|nr:hypothetical protein [Alloacidobacterium dinghuense]QNI31070.1 hypothetical protein H7849_18460 [Alloacidobacterium dinghuense]